MLQVVSVWLAVIGFAGAGVFNAVGTEGTRRDFARWGYPGWWHCLTGGLEIVVAVLIAVPSCRVVGLLVGAAIIAAGIATVLRHRDFGHLAPLGVFAVVLLAVALTR